MNSLFMQNTAKKEGSHEAGHQPHINPYTEDAQIAAIDQQYGLFKDESSVEMRIVGETIGITPAKKDGAWQLGGSQNSNML